MDQHQKQITTEGDGETQLTQTTQYAYSYCGDLNKENGNFVPSSEMCGGGEEIMMMPSLQHVSSGVWSDASYQHYDHQQQLGHYYDYVVDDDAAASMENNEDPESDYDFDFSEDESAAGDDQKVENEQDDDETFEEDEEATSSASESHVEEFVDQLQTKFQNLVYSTINAAEQYLDNPSTLHSAVLNNSSSKFAAPSGLCNDNLENLSLLQEEELEYSHQLKIKDEAACSENASIKTIECQHVEVQTDDGGLLLRSSGTIVPSNHQSLLNLKADQAELEINELKAVKESLMEELENWEVLLDEEGEMKTENEIKEAERIMCKINESVRAVERAIEFKNEIVNGAQHRPLSLSGDRRNDMEFSKLVANLDTISTQELQRLFGVYFEKTVELRFSTHELKNDLERATKRHEDLSRRYARKKERVRELQEQHKTRLLEFLSKNTDSSYYSMFRRKEEQLSAALKKQEGYEKELTTLLIRHGYLLDGMDYDVQQVVRTLGIDEDEGHLASVTAKQQGRVTRRGGISEAGTSAGGSYQSSGSGSGGGESFLDNPTSRRYDEKPTSSGRHRQRSTERNVRFRDEREPGCSNTKTRSHRTVLSPPGAGAPTLQHTAEVRRDKRRLIIHPSTTAVDSGGSGGGSSHRKNNSDSKQAGSGSRKKR